MLTNVLSDLRLAYLQASKNPDPASGQSAAPVVEAAPEQAAVAAESEPESRKRFSKSYGS
jgi:hypothetical protein